MDILDRTLVAVVLFATAFHAWHLKPVEREAAKQEPATPARAYVARRPNTGTMVERWSDYEFNHRWDGAR